MRGRSVVASAAMAVASVGVVAVAAGGASGGERSPAASAKARQAQKPVRLSGADLFIEVSATDRDAGLQLRLDGHAWRRLALRDPRGRTVLDVEPRRGLDGYGLTGLTFESGELPFHLEPFRRLRARFPEGRYRFAGTTIEGDRLIGSDRLTHDVPDAPQVVAPEPDARVDPAAGVVATWRPVTGPRGIEITGYIVTVSEDRAERELSMDLGPDVTSAAIPAAFLQPGDEYDIEVIARESSGNRTITEVPFRTTG